MPSNKWYVVQQGTHKYVFIKIMCIYKSYTNNVEVGHFMYKSISYFTSLRRGVPNEIPVNPFITKFIDLTGENS